ncbi:hypothetical protein MPSEU_000991200 [Mayamaea pseudoterrestris]|nr:hypothetical protein MPSEU_000991200 [Mayamaea pseudoterrestris]
MVPDNRFQDLVDDFKYMLREWRHNPCLMRPLTAFVILGMLLFWVLQLILRFPVLLFTFLLSWSLNRFSFVIEFLYPLSIGRWIHIRLAKTIMRSGRHGSNQQQAHHSRTIETRIEVTNRIFIHPLPQFLDNLGYLVVCLPKSMAADVRERTNNQQINGEDQHVQELPRLPANAVDEEVIVGFVIDCGDAEAILLLLDSISRVHYQGRLIHIQSILSTHKHHDHTAGNRGLRKALPSVQHVFGGAVERVPGCTHPLANGDLVPLPVSGTNDMGRLVKVEAICTPGHTRGALVYCLRTPVSTFLFTGDTMFSGGSGIAFESDGDARQDEQVNKMKPSTFIRANSSEYAIERCFAELLVRSVGAEQNFDCITADRVVMLPGHEYTKELVGRSLTQPSESSRWKNLSPAAFFETVSHYYVALHRRSLPHSTGNLLVAPTTLRRELLVNSVYRSLKARGEVVVRAVAFWHRHFAKFKVPEGSTSINVNRAVTTIGDSNKLLSRSTQWNLDVADVDRPVFATMFADDLQALVDELKTGSLSGEMAAHRLEQLQHSMDVPSITRRPFPETLPSDRIIYKGLVGLVLLGSAPAAMTLKDSKAMNVPAPVVSSSDRIIINRKRLVKVLHWLGLLSDDTGGERVKDILIQLWSEAKAYSDARSGFDLELTENNGDNTMRKGVDVEISKSAVDEVELGCLKWTLYGVHDIPTGRLAQWCMPCSSPVPFIPHPIDTSRMRINHGELVKHDPLTCPLCTSATGRAVDDMECEPQLPTNCAADRPVLLQRSISPCDDENELMSIEVGPGILDSFLREA